MNGHELRIGNITSQGKIQIFYESGVHIGFGKCYGFSEINPVKLTENWLIRLCFDSLGKTGYAIEYFKVEFSKNYGGFYQCDFLTNINGKVISLKYVHQLQNLYFALTGRELVIKDR